ncbi:ketoacyl-ACP synthase III [Sulfurospirillum diekertiae]|uniref:Ketoacyl-ACP synthase III n=1 Tax=Sulfurospirillum diekertiae TaxID=1854492 RepID=A0A6G9VRB8_9BACT|nr:ketoacyl-ACP synthase III [Sulfurospirillum diekertiae]QIR75448.1 ketoacyl-ACP synthase III [Sulfurospirillum diekertiae]QIR78096.1 ketoacyl-ACP synthase III [Sulfurospirillum diekertiae]
MLGIQEIASYLPEKKISNYDKKKQFALEDDFIENKIGVRRHGIKEDYQKASDLCVEAYSKLINKLAIKKEEIDCCIVVTQNPDYKIPHTSAIVHGKLELSSQCACFDVSLGCSGYVYGLSIIMSFMKSNQLKKGILFTADPYSEIVDIEDKNTCLLFGDAASVTYITEEGKLIPKDFSFGTSGKDYKELLCKDKLFMNGRAVFNFTATIVPNHIREFLKKNLLQETDIDQYIFHQGSKYIVDTIRKRLQIIEDKVPFDIYDYGNTISSSIPIILEKEIYKNKSKTIVISGFGVGLSWASAILEISKLQGE